MKFLPALFVSMMLCATAFAASITDANFAAVNPSYPGADNWVRGSIYFQGKLVVRGEFHVLGHKAIANLGVWDGADWQPLGSGIKGSVSDFATNPATGNLVVVGAFTSAGGVAVKNIAEWTGSTWLAVAPGLTDAVSNIAVDQKGGYYVHQYVSSSYKISYWNGSTWTAIGTADNAIIKLIVDSNNHLYAGGRFTQMDALAVNHIAKWDGTTWSALGSGRSGYIEDMTLDKTGNVYVLRSSSDSLVVKWDGQTWTSAAKGYMSTANSVCVDSLDQIYVGGLVSGLDSLNASKWNGTKMVPIAPRQPLGNVITIACVGGPVVAGGSGYPAKNRMGGLGITQLKNGVWATFTDGLDGHVVTLTKNSKGTVFLGGYLQTFGTQDLYGIAQWGGKQISPIPGVTKALGIYELAVDANENLIVAGSLDSAGGVALHNIASWNGTTWSSLGSGTDATVYHIALGPQGTVYAAGNFTTAGGVAVKGLAKWDGTSWSDLGWGADTAMSSISCMRTDPQGVLYVGNSKGYVYAFNGSSWTQMGMRLIRNSVTDLAVDSKGTLYLGYSHIVYTWNKTTQRFDTTVTLGTYNTGSAYGVAGLYKLFVDNKDQLYMGGQFDYVTTKSGWDKTAVTANGLAIWDGTTLSGVGSGFMWQDFSSYSNDGPGAIVQLDNRIIVGGTFLIAGGVVSPYLSQFYTDGTTVPTLHAHMQMVAPSPQIRVEHSNVFIYPGNGMLPRLLNGRIQSKH